MQVRVTDNKEEFGKCGCGRSPTGKCIGWHGYSEEQYQEAKYIWEMTEYIKKAKELWSDSCTSERSSDE